jgi:lipopolysaccharide export system permease protein
MKKIDKLVLSAFIGPFILTFLVVVFILLTQHMLKYFDDIIGKGLGMDVIGQLLFYFAIFMTPIAMPLAVLLSSLIAFGNLGEHFELTAIKSAGISLLRALLPIFFFVLGLTALAFYVNNNLVPSAALEAYSLLYDIKQKKPALDLREGAFYDGIPDMSIKVNKKFPDGETLKDITIYDHRKRDGNKDVTKADSGRMYTILNERYLKFELFNGYNYTEGSSSEQELAGENINSKGSSQKDITLSRSRFSKTQVVFDLSSFQLERTDKKWFQGNRIMRNLRELNQDIDSVDQEIMGQKVSHYHSQNTFFNFQWRKDSVLLPEELSRYKSVRDSAMIAKNTVAPGTSDATRPGVAKDTLSKATLTDSVKPPRLTNNIKERRSKRLADDSVNQKKSGASNRVNKMNKRNKPVVAKANLPVVKKQSRQWTEQELNAIVDSVMATPVTRENYSAAAARARTTKSTLGNTVQAIDGFQEDRVVYEIQWHKILASSLACIAMFLIGAPLGAIIKRGGLGVPFLVSILFFIIYYLLTMTGEKWAKQGIVSVQAGVWAADVILFLVGLVFLRQARVDARLFEADFYMVLTDKVRNWLIRKKILKPSIQT